MKLARGMFHWTGFRGLFPYTMEHPSVPFSQGGDKSLCQQIYCFLNEIIMSEKEMNSYRFGTGQEPTDEMLEQIMKEVAQEARESNKRATEAHFEQMRNNIASQKVQWAERINSIING